jgi:thiamine biosynthesis lipoprotein
MRKAEQIMGMPITVDIPECSDEEVFKKTFAHFKEIDKRFSPYKKSSELSKYQRGEVAENKLSAEFKKVIKACKEASNLTDGYFTAYYAGKYDPTGYVKGWAIAEAGKLINKKGYKTYCIGAGGDILARSDSKKKWNIGIQNPQDKSKILSKLSISNGAVTTSGNYERGEHIINPMTGEPADEFLSVTVAGPEIIKADVFATAVFAAGLSGLTMVEEIENYEVLAIDKKGDFYVTTGAEKLLKFV